MAEAMMPSHQFGLIINGNMLVSLVVLQLGSGIKSEGTNSSDLCVTNALV
jgi:hypothetical protein